MRSPELIDTIDASRADSCRWADVVLQEHDLVLGALPPSPSPSVREN